MLFFSRHTSNHFVAIPSDEAEKWHAEVFMLTCAGVVIYVHPSRHFVLITAHGSDLACRNFSVDLAFLSSTVM